MKYRFTFRPWPALVTGLAVIITLWLGLWQLERLQWKQDLLTRIEAQRSRPAERLPLLIDDPRRLEYRSFEVSGSFAHDQELYLFATGPEGAPGFHVYTPLIRLEAAPVLINRGWIPVRARDPATRAEGQIQGQVRVRGTARLSRVPGMFTPENNAATNNWYYADLEAMTRALPLASLSPVIIDADAQPNPGGLPMGGVTRFNIPNNHLSYALTWFFLALTVVTIYLVFSFRPEDESQVA